MRGHPAIAAPPSLVPMPQIKKVPDRPVSPGFSLGKPELPSIRWGIVAAWHDGHIDRCRELGRPQVGRYEELL